MREGIAVEEPSDKKWGFIKTLEGDQIVRWNDWIILGIRGEIYPCKPDIFKKTYTEVQI